MKGIIRNAISNGLIFFILIGSIQILKAQNTQRNNPLVKKLELEKVPAKRLALLIELLNETGETDSAGMEWYSTEGLQIAAKLRDEKSAAEIHRQKGISYQTFENYSAALSQYNAALKLAEKNKSYILIGDIYNNMSNLYMEQDNDKLKDEYLQKALKIYQDQHSESDVALVYANMGANFNRKGNSLKAVEYLLKSLQIREKIGYQYGIALVSFNIVTSYKSLKRYNEALQYSDLSIRKFKELNNEIMLANNYAVRASILRSQKKLQEATSFINMALPAFTKVNFVGGLMNSYDNLGLIAVQQKDLNKAMDYFLKSKALALKHNKNQGIVSSDINIAQTALDLKDKKTATAAVEEAEIMARKYKLQKELAEIYKLKLQFLVDANQPEVFSKTFNEYFVIADSVNGEDVNRQISEMQTKYETEKKDNEILLLNKEKGINLLQIQNQNLSIAQKQSQITQQGQALLINKLELNNKNQRLSLQEIDAHQKAQNIKTLQKQSRIQTLELDNRALQLKQRNLLIIGVLLITMAIGLIAYFSYKRYKARQEAKLLEEVNRQQEIATKSLFEGEQKERIRLARDLHDSIGQMLSVVKMNMSTLQHQFPDNKTTTGTLDLVDKTIGEVRNISHNLLPEALNFGLFSALEDMTDKINEGGGAEVELIVPEAAKSHQFSKQNELSIYRIVQEVLGNMVKHAEATKISLTVLMNESGLSIAIKDNGKGFDTDKIAASKGIGWKNIFARVNLLDGEMRVQSEQLTGTQIEITIPG